MHFLRFVNVSKVFDSVHSADVVILLHVNFVNLISYQRLPYGITNFTIDLTQDKIR